MGFRLEVLLLTVTVCISIILFLGMRSGAVRGGFVVLWLIICATMTSLPFLEPLYKHLAEFMGLSFARDMLHMFAILFLMLYVFYLTAKLQRIADVVEIMQARAAIVESHLGLGLQNCKEIHSTDKENGLL